MLSKYAGRGRRSVITDGHYPARVVLELVKITYRQLDHWTRAGLAHPANADRTQRGKFRLYSPTDVLALKVAKRLLDAGISLARVQKAIKYLRKHAPKADNPLAQYTFIANGKQILVLTQDTGKLVDITKGGQLVFAMVLTREVRELAEIGALTKVGRLERKKLDIPC